MKAIFSNQASKDMPIQEIYGDVRGITRILYLFIGVVLIGLIAGIVIVLAHDGFVDAAILAAVILPVLASAYLVKREKFEGAVTFLAIVLILANTLLASRGLGIHHISNFAYPAILIIASLIIRKRTLFVLISLTIICLAWLVFGELFGLYTPSALVRSVPGDFFSASLIVLITVVLIRSLTGPLFQSFLQLQKEIAGRNEVEESLRQREAILQSVTFAAEQFLKTADWRENINVVLERLGKTIHATHAYIFEKHTNAQGESVYSMRYEWTSSGFTSDMDDPEFQNTPLFDEDFERYFTTLGNGEPFIGSTSLFLPVERERFSSLGIKAILEVPLVVDGLWWGTIGFDDMVQERAWSASEVDVLRVAAGILCAAIERQLNENVLKHELAERGRAETAYRLSEDKFSRAFQTMPIMMTIEDENHVFIDVNGAFLEIFGFERDEVLGQTASDLGIVYNPDDLMVLRREYQQNGFLKNFEIRFRRKSGEEGVALLSSESFRVDNAVYTLTSGLDITERKYAEDERENLISDLRAKNDELETLRETTVIVTSTLDISEAVQRILQQLKRVVSYDSASVWLYKDSHAQMVGGDGLPDMVMEDKQYVVNGDEPDYPLWDRHLPYVLLDDVQINYAQFRNPPINYIHGWLAIPLKVRDELTGFISLDGRRIGQFTDRDAQLALNYANQVSIAIEKARLFSDLQKELKERESLIQKLETTNAETEALRESLTTIVGTLEFSEVIQHILDQVRRVVPYDSASVWKVEGNLQVFVGGRNLPPEITSNISYLTDEMNAARPILVGDVPYMLQNDVQAVLRDFRQPPHNYINSWLAVPLKTKGKIIGLLALDGIRRNQFTDRHVELAVTYADQVAIALENSLLFANLQQQLSVRKNLIAELESKNAELERFTYTVSHDLKSPLVTINGFLGYLEKDAKSGNMERLGRDIQRIQEAVDKMRLLLSDLLELSRIGRLASAPQMIPFADLAEDALKIVHGQIEERSITVVIQPGLPAVFGDRQRLTEVLQNLLDNAAKFIGDERNPKIEIGQRGEEEGKPVLFVKDNGIGMAFKYHEQVFGLFNKLDPDIEGTGIGLALVKRIVEVHGGRIWVESEGPGKGSTFLFTLPRGGE